VCGALAVLGVAAFGAVTAAQQGAIGAMYAVDQKRERALEPSFATATLASTVRVYLSAGDLERAFDTASFRPDAAIVPTNTALALAAASPATQRILIDRVRQDAATLKELDAQAAARRNIGPMQVGTDTFVARLPGSGRFPKTACFIATDFAQGGSVDQRDLFTQDRVRQGVAACLAALDSAGAVTVTMPLMGASSSETQKNDPVFEGQRLLKECRLINSVAGLALGIHDFVPKRRNIREIGIVQWVREFQEMFNLPNASKIERASYESYAEYITVAWRKGLEGLKTTPGDVGGNCATTFSAP
jgi:hypothetical protein